MVLIKTVIWLPVLAVADKERRGYFVDNGFIDIQLIYHPSNPQSVWQSAQCKCQHNPKQL